MCHFCADSSGPRAVEVAPDSRNASHATTDQTRTYLSSFLTVQIGSLRNSSDALPAAPCATHSHHHHAQAGEMGLRASASQLHPAISPRWTNRHHGSRPPQSPPQPSRQAPSLASSKARKKLTPAIPYGLQAPPSKTGPPHQRAKLTLREAIKRDPDLKSVVRDHPALEAVWQNS